MPVPLRKEEPLLLLLDDVDEELQDVVDRQEALLDRLDALDEKSQKG